MIKKRREKFLLLGLNLALIAFALFLLPTGVEARSGCCSWHGGVCGCECCDGTSLSDTCAPYYPECNENDEEDIYVPPAPPKPTVITYNSCQIQAKTNDEVVNFDKIYQEELNRKATCEELQNNVNKTTPHEKLREQLRNSDEYKKEHAKTEVVDVVDGDTIKVRENNEVKTVRLIGIDTPETVHPTKPVECFGKEASEKMKELVSSKEVRLERDEQNDDKDKYDRYLRYVYLVDDNKLVNALMIQEGYAYAYTQYPFRFLDDFKKYQEEARKNKKGLWANGICEKEKQEKITSATTEQKKSVNLSWLWYVLGGAGGGSVLTLILGLILRKKK